MTIPTIQRNTYVASLTLLERQGFSGATLIDIGAAEGNFFVTRHLYKLFIPARHFFVDEIGRAHV